MKLNERELERLIRAACSDISYAAKPENSLRPKALKVYTLRLIEIIDEYENVTGNKPDYNGE